MNHFNTIMLAQSDWDKMVQSMNAAFDGTDHTIKLLVGIGILIIFWINMRLARWLNKKFAPTH